MATQRITFEEALRDAQYSDELMPAIAQGLDEVQQRVTELYEDFGSENAIVGHPSPASAISESIRYIERANQLLEEYEPYIEHYPQLREHF